MDIKFSEGNTTSILCLPSITIAIFLSKHAFDGLEISMWYLGKPKFAVRDGCQCQNPPKVLNAKHTNKSFPHAYPIITMSFWPSSIPSNMFYLGMFRLRDGCASLHPEQGLWSCGRKLGDTRFLLGPTSSPLSWPSSLLCLLSS